MKRLISIVLVGLMILTLIACGVEEKTVVYVGDVNGTTVEFRISAEGDKIKKVVREVITDVSLEEEEVLDSAIETLEEQYNSVSGVTYTATREGDELREITTMDFSSKEKIQAISALGLIEAEGEANYVSLKATIKILKAQGLSEK